MIRVAPSAALTRAERFGLDVLVDLSRLLVAGPGVDAALTLSVLDDGPHPAPLTQAVENQWWIEAAGEGEVRIGRSALARLAQLCSAAAEQRSSAKDRFGRVPPEENELVASGIEGTAVVSRAAARLATVASHVAGRRPFRTLQPWPGGKRWAVALTHDLDAVDWWPAFTGLRLVELARKKEIGRALRVVGAALGAAAGKPTESGVGELLGTEAGAGVPATWFVLCGTPTFATMRAGDLTYDPDGPLATRMLERIARAGHEIGLHGSFETADDGSRFPGQRGRLASLTGRSVAGVRQHYLRMRPATTPGHMAAAGFTYDSTFGFADRNGFRLGVADVLPAWSVEKGAPAGIELAPFAWMDRALSKYRGVEEPGAWVDDGLRLAAECRAVSGLWVGVWHPNLTPALGYPGAPNAYRRLVRALAADDPYFGTLGEIVAWRAARRAVRATAIAPDGSVVATAPRFAGAEPRLEGSDGRPLERVSAEAG